MRIWLDPDRVAARELTASDVLRAIREQNVQVSAGQLGAEPMPNGSDFPVERVDPLISFHAAVTRQDAANWPAGGWHPEQRMTRDEALWSMTLWPAVAAFQERDMGTLAAGKYADFVVFDRDPMRAAPEEILRARVLATYLGGRAVYEAK